MSPLIRFWLFEQRNRLNLLGIGLAAMFLCMFAIGVRVHWNQEPSYDGHPLNYWLDRLEPTLESTTAKTFYKLHDKGDGIRFFATHDYLNWAINRQAARVIKKSGAECLPFLIERLRVRETPRPVIALRELAFTLRLVDAVPVVGSSSQVRRQQAITAILLLGDRASPILPLLVALAHDNNRETSLAASFVLSKIAPEEFRRLRGSRPPAGN